MEMNGNGMKALEWLMAASQGSSSVATRDILGGFMA
jgi:hypothetical protein